MKVSACICTRNRAENLKRLLPIILGFVDEIIIVDGMSNDDTLSVAYQFTDKVFVRNPCGYVEPDRLYCISQARNNWVLVLDDDETPSRSLLKDLDALTNRCVDAYLIPRRNHYCKDKYYQHIHYPDYQLRLFKKNNARVSEKIHSRPLINGVVESLSDKYYLIHYDAIYSNKSKYRRYAWIQANESVPCHHFVLYFAYANHAFLKSFIRSLQGECYLDGWPGVRAAYGLAYYEWCLNMCKMVVKCKSNKDQMV